MNVLKSFLILMAFAYAGSVNAVIIPNAPVLSAKGYILIDANSGDVLAESDADVQVAPASLTKLMTAYVVGQEIVNGRLAWDTSVEVSRKAWSANFPESSKMFIKPGDDLNVQDLMQGLIIQSGNDAAVALAEHVAGDEIAFVSLMNGWAQSLGMTNTNFINAHGLDGESIATTPRDMATLLKAVINDVPEVYSLYNKRRFTWNGIEQYNRNKLLWDKTLNVDGGKTGYTEAAGYSLVSSATQGRMRLISVVMGTASAQTRVNESRQLLNYGFRFYDTLQVGKKGEELYRAGVWKGDVNETSVQFDEDVFITLPRTQVASVEQILELNETLMAPVKVGDAVGEVVWSVEGQPIKRVNVVSADNIEQGTMFKRIKDAVLLWLSSLLQDVKSLVGEW